MSSLGQGKIQIKENKALKLRLIISVLVFITWAVILFNIFKDISYFLDWFEDLGSLAPILFLLILFFENSLERLFVSPVNADFVEA